MQPSAALNGLLDELLRLDAQWAFTHVSATDGSCAYDEATGCFKLGRAALTTGSLTCDFV